jgi:hypothetical protein
MEPNVGCRMHMTGLHFRKGKKKKKECSKGGIKLRP